MIWLLFVGLSAWWWIINISETSFMAYYEFYVLPGRIDRFQTIKGRNELEHTKTLNKNGFRLPSLLLKCLLANIRWFWINFNWSFGLAPVSLPSIYRKLWTHLFCHHCIEPFQFWLDILNESWITIRNIS